MERSRNLLLCSFCGKDEEEVERVFVGPAVYICNECLMVCNSILIQEARREENEEKRKQIFYEFYGTD